MEPENTFKEADLPRADLTFLNLYVDNKVVLEKKDLDALLSGSRTSVISLQNLSGDGYNIQHVDAKISLKKSRDGNCSILIHPIYNNPVSHDLLSEKEQLELINGTLSNVLK